MEKTVVLSVLAVVALIIAILWPPRPKIVEKSNISYIDIPWMSIPIERFGQPNDIKLYYETNGRVIFFTWINDRVHNYLTVVAYWDYKNKIWDLAGVYGGMTVDPAELRKEMLLEMLREFQKKQGPQLEDPTKPVPLGI
jgi:hypothetical protein